MPKLDSNIYGADDNVLAGNISSDALGSPSAKNPIDQSALSRGVDTSGPNPDVKITSDRGPAKKSEGN